MTKEARAAVDIDELAAQLRAVAERRQTTLDDGKALTEQAAQLVQQIGEEMTVADLARAAGVSRETVYAWRRS